jgi:hypothetical protein
MTDNGHVQHVVRDGVCLRVRGILLLKCGCIGLLFGVLILPLTDQLIIRTKWVQGLFILCAYEFGVGGFVVDV